MANWSWKSKWVTILLNEPSTPETKILGIINKLRPNNKVILSGNILDIACRQNRLKIIQKLFDKGMNPNIEYSSSSLPVFFSSDVLSNDVLFKLFLRYGAKVENKKHGSLLKFYVKRNLNELNFNFWRKIIKLSNFSISVVDITECSLQYLANSKLEKNYFLLFKTLIDLENKILILRESKETENIFDLSQVQKQQTTTMNILMKKYLSLTFEDTKIKKCRIIFLIAKMKQRAALSFKY